MVDPVAFAFDHRARLFVVEMPGYPNGGLGDGTPKLAGRIRLLEDKDGDGFFETSGVFARNLRFPTSVCPWRDGVLVADTPDLVFLRDTNDDGVCDQRTVLYTGFGTRNIQQLLNGLQYHRDGWIYACNGANESVIKRPDDPKFSVRLGGRHFRFRPDEPARFEPLSGGGQYGLTVNDRGAWFTCTNSEVLKQIVLEDRYLQNNPWLAASGAAVNISDHGAAAKVFRISPFEEWRLERTRRRVGENGGARYPVTERIPGGYITSGTGLLCYRGGLLPPEYHGDVFTCDPANNLVHRMQIDGPGPQHVGRRREEVREFLASTDIWFRPVFLGPGPEGAIYLADFYREIIETPLSLPDDIKKAWNLDSRERGRIWRIRPAGKRPAIKHIARETDSLIEELNSPNAWRRLSAQPLLVARKDEALKELNELRYVGSAAKPGKLHAVWVLREFGLLTKEHNSLLFVDAAPAIREEGLRVAEPLAAQADVVQAGALHLVNDPDPRVRFQLACSLGGWDDPRAGDALVALAKKDGADPWISLAILTAAKPHLKKLLAEIVADPSAPVSLRGKLVQMIARAGSEELRAAGDLLRSARSSAQLELVEAWTRGWKLRGPGWRAAPEPETVKVVA
ncbi:MAG TPA: PVC-type heme-binding CxxCH protein, partial [Planctomycetia bacterium]|nr:PVC-type heme-binding CxxCH protein [Planctomycetia bacterium]